ncbi:MAG: Na+/H+ antiporter subunit E [Dorea sp.]|nr:Na+/H+ antiporter subunit E [Dorea sp.]
MYIVLFVLWVMLNGKLNLEIALFGLVISAALYWFICKFMGYSLDMELAVAKCGISLTKYIVLLIVEIIKANLATAKMILTFEEEPVPVLVKFKSDLKTQAAQTLLANSITLTPGTITVELEDGDYLVHALDESFAVDIDKSSFVDALEALENEAERKGWKNV